MKQHDVLDDAARERAAAHAIGGLDAGEARDMEQHLAACAPCREEVETLRAVAGQLALLAPGAAPPAGLRARLVERLRATSQGGLRPVPAAAQEPPAQAWKAWRADTPALDGLTYVARDATGWQQTVFEGVQARRLFVDEANDRVTMLVRMAPGSSYPAHVHGGAEECYVLEGDLQVGDLRMGAGDYQRAERGVSHPVQATRNGCLLFLVSSLHDELLSA